MFQWKTKAYWRSSSCSLTYTPLRKGRGKGSSSETWHHSCVPVGLSTGVDMLISFSDVVQPDCSFYTKE